MSFFIFADFLKKVFSHVSGISEVTRLTPPLAYPPPPVPNQAEKPEDQQSQETLENARKIENYP